MTSQAIEPSLVGFSLTHHYQPKLDRYKHSSFSYGALATKERVFVTLTSGGGRNSANKTTPTSGINLPGNLH
jgi:hypothetical protein